MNTFRILWLMFVLRRLSRHEMASEYLTTCPYTSQEETLRPLSGRHLIAQYDDTCVVVYQTFSSDIAEFAVTNGYFGGPLFDFNRTTWFKLSFLLTMSLSDWATRPGKERVLAVKINRAYFLEMLETATSTGVVYQTPPGKVVSEAVTLIWEPDYRADSDISDRYTLMIGLRSFMMKKFNNKYIEAIEDITDFVIEQRVCALNKEYGAIVVPVEIKFLPEDNKICRKLLLDGFYEAPALDDLNAIIEIESLRKSKFKSKVVISLQGAFNPVHTKHVQIMLECKEWLEKNRKCTVLAGIMLVRGDQLVSDKIKEVDKDNGLVIKSEHRLKMCEISVMQHRWIFSVELIGKPCSMTLLKNAKINHNNVTVLSLFGADRGMDMCKHGLDNAIIIGRDGVTDKLQETYGQSIKKGLVNKDNVHIMPVEMENISSTEIRRDLKIMSSMRLEEEKQEIMRKLVERGWLDKNIGCYLVDNEHEMYQHINEK